MNFVERTVARADQNRSYKAISDNNLLMPLIPSYSDERIGDWSITSNENLIIPTSGYFGRHQSFFDVKLYNHSQNYTMMSVSAAELEAMIVPLNEIITTINCCLDKGDVPRIAIGGLGMGVLLINVINYCSQFESDVDITVFEVDPDMPKLLMASLVDDSYHLLNDAIEGFSNVSVSIEISDIHTTPVTKQVYDIMYVDIWANMADAEKDMHRIVKRGWAKAYTFWGEELTIAKVGLHLIDDLKLSQKYTNGLAQLLIDSFENNFGFSVPEEILSNCSNS